VFLKNVLIYFDRASKNRALANVQAMVRPGGMLVAGAAEGVADILRGYNGLNPGCYANQPTKPRLWL